MQTANEERLEAVLCPSCRGPGHLVSIWRYIDIHGAPTQNLGQGMQAQNLYTGATAMTVNGGEGGFTAPAEGQQIANGGPLTTGVQQPPAMYVEASEPKLAYHIHTRLADGRPAMLIDIGSVGNLCGDRWAKTVAQAAAQHGQTPKYEQRPRALRISGVGVGTQSCAYDCKLPVALKQAEGGGVTIGHLTTPTVSNSDLPGLLGLTALRKNRAVLDLSSLKMYFCGPGDYDVATALPPGTECFQGEIAPSGHLIVPCCEYQSGSASEEHALTLMTRAAVNGRRVPPPPPAAPPVLPAALPVQTQARPPDGRPE